MRGASFDRPPLYGKAIHQVVDQLLGVTAGMGGQVGVFGRRQNASVAEDFLHLEQIDSRFDEMRGIAVSQAVQGDLFFIPQAATTLRIVV